MPTQLSFLTRIGMSGSTLRNIQLHGETGGEAIRIGVEKFV